MKAITVPATVASTIIRVALACRKGGAFVALCGEGLGKGGRWGTRRPRARARVWGAAADLDVGRELRVAVAPSPLLRLSHRAHCSSCDTEH